jgi:hypothetical protein
MVDIKLKDILVAVFALILAYIASWIIFAVFGIIWTLTFFILKVIVVLVLAYIVYQFLKRL